MKNIIIVSKFTFIEVYRSKVMISIVFIGIGLFLISYVASEFAYGASAKVALDFGFGLMSLSNLIMSIFIGSSLLSKEIENRTIYMILSRPISRSEFILGKIMGLSSVLIINTILLSLISTGIYKFLGGDLSFLMFWGAWFTFFESIIILLFSILFSLVTGPALAVIYTITVWIAGHSLGTTSKIFFAKSNLFFSSVLKVVTVILPDLEKLNLKDLIIYEQNLPPAYIFKIQIYSLCYIVALLLLVSLVFKNKNLD